MPLVRPVTQANPVALKSSFSPFLLPSQHCKQIQLATCPWKCCSAGPLGVVVVSLVAIRSVVGNSPSSSLMVRKQSLVDYCFELVSHEASQDRTILELKIVKIGRTNHKGINVTSLLGIHTMSCLRYMAACWVAYDQIISQLLSASDQLQSSWKCSVETLRISQFHIPRQMVLTREDIESMSLVDFLKCKTLTQSTSVQ